MVFLIDSNVLLDIIQDDPTWASWSEPALESALAKGAVGINQLIYSELSTLYASAAPLDRILEALTVSRIDLPWQAAHAAGQAFVQYRRRGGIRTSPLPDFYIGAHAFTSGLTLLTRDARRYRSYFPALKLIAPDHG